MKLLGENYLGGKVPFTTSPSEGTTFFITLPRETAESGDTASSEKGKVPSGKKHILFVDDQEALLRLGTRFLAKLGFAVTACSGGEQALAAFHKSPASFHLCLTDFSMPGMDGMELAHKLYAERPGMPIVLSTGLGQDGVNSSELPPNCSILHKPFTFPELKTALEEALK
jgi:DNA-binding NtrC family response regulator